MSAAATGGEMAFSGDGSTEFWKRFTKIVDLAWSDEDEDEDDDDDTQPIKRGLSKSRSFGNLKELTDLKELGKRKKRSLSMNSMPSVLDLPKNDDEQDDDDDDVDVVVVHDDDKVEKLEKKNNNQDGK